MSFIKSGVRDSKDSIVTLNDYFDDLMKDKHILLRYVSCCVIIFHRFFKYIFILCFSLKQLKVTLRVFPRLSIHMKNKVFFVMV